jgi:hypothetical protein
MEPSSDTKWCEPLEHVVKQPTRKNTNSQKKFMPLFILLKRSLLIWKLRNLYMSGYAFIYTDSALKQTLMNPVCGLIWGPLTIKPK